MTESKFAREHKRRQSLRTWQRLREIAEAINGTHSMAWTRRGVQYDLQYLILDELTEVITTGDPDDLEDYIIEDIYADLTWLAEILDQALSLTQGRLEDKVVLGKIAQLRNSNGRTEAEMVTANKVAARLEQKLQHRLGPIE
jgi:hypothetical protein